MFLAYGLLLTNGIMFWVILVALCPWLPEPDFMEALILSGTLGLVLATLGILFETAMWFTSLVKDQLGGPAGTIPESGAMATLYFEVTMAFFYMPMLRITKAIHDAYVKEE